MRKPCNEAWNFDGACRMGKGTPWLFYFASIGQRLFLSLESAASLGEAPYPLFPMSAERKTLEEREQMSDLDRLRHSCAHVMATAILRLWPDAQFAYGPPVESGFYYDFDLKHRITPDDFEKIEAEMKKVAKENQKFEKKVISREEATALAKSGRLGGLSERPGNESVFKLDLIAKIPEGEEISCYQNGEFIDLCAGPHVNYTSKCKNVKLMSIASAYYMGDETKPPRGFSTWMAKCLLNLRNTAFGGLGLITKISSSSITIGSSRNSKFR